MKSIAVRLVLVVYIRSIEPAYTTDWSDVVSSCHNSASNIPHVLQTCSQGDTSEHASAYHVAARHIIRRFYQSKYCAMLQDLESSEDLATKLNALFPEDQIYRCVLDSLPG